jgi:hypothetical protein
MRSTALRALGAAACLAVAAVLVLLALDAHAWGTRLPADDLRVRHDALAPKLWQPRQLLPFGLSKRVLGITDDLDYRRALHDFRIGRPREPFIGTDVAVRRIRAQIALQDFVDRPGDDRRRSQAANLIGILGFAAATQDAAQQITFLNNAIGNFRAAIVLDPTNEDAHSNLEYALGQLKEAAEQQAGPSDRLGQAGGAGATETGHGY